MNPKYPGLPIDPEILVKRKEIPEKIARISYKDEAIAIKYLRIWGEKKMPITPLFDELCNVIKSLEEVSV